MIDVVPPAPRPTASDNIDVKTVEGFGEEWAAFDQQALTPAEHRTMFDQYFSPFPFEALPPDAEGMDLGCGSGRWAVMVAPRVGLLHCIDPSDKALDVCRERLRERDNVRFHLASADAIPLADESLDFAYSLGVLHHIPDTARALEDAVRKLKPGAPFLLYLYYDFENRPAWFRALWKGTDLLRRVIAPLPFGARKAITTGIAATVYWPLSRSASLLERAGVKVSNIPLSAYRYRSFYSLRTDALDRFGTRLEQRFSKEQIAHMMSAAGLVDIRFRDDEPFWCVCGRKS